MKNIYLDNVSTTPIDPEVTKEMLPYISDNFGNPASMHAFGEKPRNAINEARKRVAELIGSSPDEIIITSGATESNNLAVKGAAKGYLRSKKHIISSPLEHYSVLHCLKSLKKDGAIITTLKVDKWGMVNPEDVRREIREDTAFVTVTHASNEIGTLEPIEEIGQITKEKGILFHADATQTVGNIPVDVKKLNVDFMTISPHQFYGPKGIGALFVKNGSKLLPLIEGGTQESGFRAGTENVPGIVGMGKAASLAKNNMSKRLEHIKSLQKHIRDNFNIPYTVLTGHNEKRLPGMLSMCFEYIEGESVLLFLSMGGIAASTGSACASALKTSHVLSAIGIRPEVAQGSLIFSFGKDNSMEDADILLEKLPAIVEKLRKMSPLYNK